MKIAITGHRPNKLGNDYDLSSDLIKEIAKEIFGILVKYSTGFESKVLMNYAEPNGVIGEMKIKLDGLTLITGMALGIDTLFAQIAIDNNIPFIAAIPCKFQDSKWRSENKLLYNALINHPLCTKHWISQTPYTKECMSMRNEWMVDNCDLLIAVWDGSPGGTANCIRYAKDRVKMVQINPKLL